jgi:hypothetical protein
VGLLFSDDGSAKKFIIAALALATKSPLVGPERAALRSGTARGQKSRSGRRQFRLAEAIVEKNPEAAQRRLSEIIAEFPETEAAEEARQWLTRADFQSQQPAAEGRAGDATEGKRGSDRTESVLPVAESESPVSPEQLEREVNMFLRMSLAELLHRPIPLRARMRELMQRYPNTKAAAFAQRVVEAISADMQQSGNAPSLQDEAGAAPGTSGN